MWITWTMPLLMAVPAMAEPNPGPSSVPAPASAPLPTYAVDLTLSEGATTLARPHVTNLRDTSAELEAVNAFGDRYTLAVSARSAGAGDERAWIRYALRRTAEPVNGWVERHDYASETIVAVGRPTELAIDGGDTDGDALRLTVLVTPVTE